MPIKDATVVKLRDDLHNLLRCVAAIRNVDIRVAAEEMIEEAIVAEPHGSMMLARASEAAEAAKKDKKDRT